MITPTLCSRLKVWSSPCRPPSVTTFSNYRATKPISKAECRLCMMLNWQPSNRAPKSLDKSWRHAANSFVRAANKSFSILPIRQCRPIIQLITAALFRLSKNLYKWLRVISRWKIKCMTKSQSRCRIKWGQSKRHVNSRTKCLIRSRWSWK